MEDTYIKIKLSKEKEMKEKYYGERYDNSCEYYKERIKNIISDIREYNDPPVSLVRNIACAKSCEYGDNKPFLKLNENLLNLAGSDLMIKNLIASGHTTLELQNIIREYNVYDECFKE